MTTRAPLLLYSIVRLPLGIALIAWGITHGYLNYRGDQCSQVFDTHAVANQVAINHVQARLEAIRTREAALGVRAEEFANKFNESMKDRK